LANPFFKQIGDSMVEEGRKHGYDVLVVSGEFDVAKGLKALGSEPNRRTHSLSGSNRFDSHQGTTSPRDHEQLPSLAHLFTQFGELYFASKRPIVIMNLPMPTSWSVQKQNHLRVSGWRG
jgi:hypothetical protein